MHRDSPSAATVPLNRPRRSRATVPRGRCRPRSPRSAGYTGARSRCIRRRVVRRPSCAQSRFPVTRRQAREERVRERARAVVIGGGVGGCSILYWLTRLGWEDVVLVERADLTSGSTFHSAGLVGQLRSSLSLTRMMMDSRRPLPDADRRGGARDRMARGRLAAARVVARSGWRRSRARPGGRRPSGSRSS